MPKDAQGSDTTDPSNDFFTNFAREALGMTAPPATFDGTLTSLNAADLPEYGFDVFLATGALPQENHAPVVDGHVAYDPSLDSDPHDLAAIEGVDQDMTF